MKKVYSIHIPSGCFSTLVFSVFLQKNGKFTTVFESANGKKHKEKNLTIDEISSHLVHKETIKQEVLRNIDCKIFNVSYTTRKQVRCGFGGYRIVTKKHNIKNVPERELFYYKNEANLKIIEEIK